MATAKHLYARHHAASPGRTWLIRAALALLVAGVVLLAANWQSLRGSAVAGASYGARVACSCRYIAGRSIKDCRKDLEPGMALISLWDDPANHSVTAHFPLLSSQTARFAPGQGCVLEAWY